MDDIKCALISELLYNYYKDDGIYCLDDELEILKEVMGMSPEEEDLNNHTYVLLKYQAVKHQIQYNLLRAYIESQPEDLQLGLQLRYKAKKSIQVIATTLIMTASSVSDLNKAFCKNAYDYVYLYKLSPNDIFIPSRLLTLIDCLTKLLITANELDPEYKILSHTILVGYEFQLTTYQQLSDQVKQLIDMASDNERLIIATKMQNPHDASGYIASELNFAYTHISRVLSGFKKAVVQCIIENLRNQLVDTKFDITKSERLKDILSKAYYIKKYPRKGAAACQKTTPQQASEKNSKK